MSKNRCKQCGKCCRTIALQISKKEINELYKKDSLSYDLWFMSKYFIQMSNEKAYKINKSMKNWSAKHFFYCKAFDPKTNKCTLHGNKYDWKNKVYIRPKICSEYPYYQKKKLRYNERFYSEECGYKDAPRYKKPKKKEN